MMRNLKPRISSPSSLIRDHDPHLFCAIGRWSLVILGFLLRLAPVGRYVTPDEPAWIYRAIRFADALTAHDWAAVPSTGHPGVTTMWLGVIGVEIQRWLTPAESTTHLDWIRHLAWLAPENGEAFRHLAFFLSSGRIAIALVTTLALVILYLLLAHLSNSHVALLATGLLAFDSFFIGHSGILHTDALLAIFCLLALVAALNELREPHRAVWAALSGFFAGLALLTKTSAAALLPFILLILAISHVRRAKISDLRSQTRHLLSIVGHSVMVISISVLTCFVLYPVFWANPASALNTMFAFTSKLVQTAPRPIFFAGQMTYDPGFAFYPTVFLFRISPVTLVGLVVGLITLRRLPSEHRLAFLLLVGFAVGFGGLISLGAKKHDRYLLPALLPLSLAAALALSQTDVLSSMFKVWPTELKLKARRLVPLALIGLQFAIALPFIAYPLTFFNPLVGGPWAAVRFLSTDWGEGMGAAARWLNRMSNADQITVAALSVPSFASLFDGRTVPLDRASQADYFVVGSNQSTDQAPNQSSNQPADQPAHTTMLGFLDHARIYVNAAPSHQSAYLAAHTASDDLILLDATTPLLRQYTGPGTLIPFAGLPDLDSVSARLAELSTSDSSMWLVADPAASPVTAEHLRRVLEAIATPASVATVAGSTISQYISPSSQFPEREPRLAAFGAYLGLTDVLLPSDPVNSRFAVFLRWQVLASTPTDLRASLRLRDSNGHLYAEVGQLILNDVGFPTSAWSPGQWADNALTMTLPAHIPPGTYAVELTVADADGAQMGAWNADGRFEGVRVHVGTVEIAPPAEPTFWTPQSVCEDTRLVIAGPLLTCMPELPRQTIPSGDLLTLALIWSATSPPEVDYHVRWRLLDAAGSVRMEQITGLCPYTTSAWREGDSFESRYALRLDPTLPAGSYILVFSVLAPDGKPLWSEDEALTTIEVLPRERLFALPSDITHPLHFVLGNMVNLLGFDLGHTRANPGDTLPLTIYWQASGPTDLNYTLFVHLVGPDGFLHGQVDQFPDAGAAPTTSWAPGQVVIDEISLPVASDAPSGTYRVAVGMYDAASGGRLPVTDASGDLLPDDQVILPVEVTVDGGAQ